MNLIKAWDTAPPILHIPQLEFRSGKLTCILGPTGCGKTTLLNILSGIDTDYIGEVTFNPVGSPRVSYQFQMDLLLPWKSVRENLLTGYYATDTPPPASSADIWLDVLDLRAVADAYPASLSVGMRQRAAIGRTLAWDGTLRLLDEPLSAQDFHHRVALESVLRKELRRSGTVGIVVTHNLEQAIFLADRIIVLGGRPSRVLDDFDVDGIDETNRAGEAGESLIVANYIARVVRALGLSGNRI